MITQPISKLLFIDLESVGIEKNYMECVQNNPKIATMFDNYFDWFLKKYPEDNHDLIENHLKDYVFFKRAGLIPEFAKIICVSIAYIDDSGELHKETIANHDEFEVLKKVQTILKAFSRLDFYLCGHNLKNFDIPMLQKRFVINGLLPPSILPTYNTKPWDAKVLDTRDIWVFGQQGSISSLDLLCTSMGIESSKNGDIKASEVHEQYWINNRLEDIANYCEKDVQVLIDFIIKITNLK
jgi:predicted PolB exonuclease-like 3'-5' exonuclease